MKGWNDRLSRDTTVFENDIDLPFQKHSPLSDNITGNIFQSAAELQEYINKFAKSKHFTVTRNNRGMPSNLQDYGVIKY
jgi:hypothetical protein